ncbi:hypothetical protein FA10DRAFT_303631 [Acaromyces ingoldii]|uniref:RA-domain-containing protein n=1 Tax=Acaromyces ingoldii TaxID=215250 RepID=A0A316YHM2_9BASI|nr:hypothetical protein FA10DRAFT_303631 [Acaromyces ingoldii]PWN88699.1 hypothetical protein FA10DRAFT_303631 [Acaromyces ingoldii]
MATQDGSALVAQQQQQQQPPVSQHPLEWTQADVVSWLATLTPTSNLSRSYGGLFAENDIEGEALINLDPDSLKEIGVGSIGHRLVILRGIYDLKIRWAIELDEGDWRPDDSHQSSASTSYGGPAGVQALGMGQVSAEHMLKALKERDERVRALEVEVSRLEDWLVRYAAAAGSTRVENLQAYIAPNHIYSFIPAEMLPRRSIQHQQSSAAFEHGMASSSSQGPVPVHTPSSAYSGPTTATSPGVFAEPGSAMSLSDQDARNIKTPTTSSTSAFSAASNEQQQAPSSSSPLASIGFSGTSNGPSVPPSGEAATEASTPSATPTSAYPPGSSGLTSGSIDVQRLAATPTGPVSSLSPSATSSSSAAALASPNDSLALKTPSSATTAAAVSSTRSASASASAAPDAGAKPATSGSSAATTASGDNLYKSFRVTLDDPCHKVLPAALRKYKISDDWRLYALFISYGNSDNPIERCLSYDEKPLLLFQKLKDANQNPVFMLRHQNEVKSPIAIAKAKAAKKQQASAGGGGGGTPSTSPGESKSSAAAAKAKGKVADAVARLGGATGSKDKGGGGGGDEAGGSGGASARDEAGSKKRDESAAPMVNSPPGQPLITGPAADLAANSRKAEAYAIAIYLYSSERDDEFDVNVGDTFIVLSKAKGWWIVQRDTQATGTPDVTGVVRKEPETEGELGEAINGGEIKSGWVPAGCLIETSRPLAAIVDVQALATTDKPGDGVMAAAQAQAIEGGNVGDGGDASAPSPLSSSGTPSPDKGALSAKMALAPIPPQLITSSSTPGILLMDYKAPQDGIPSLPAGTRLRVFKRYNHWSYCVVEGEGHARAWMPSWFISKLSGSSSSGQSSSSRKLGAPSSSSSSAAASANPTAASSRNGNLLTQTAQSLPFASSSKPGTEGQGTRTGSIPLL